MNCNPKTFTQLCYMLRIPFTYFLTVLTCPHGMKFQKWSPQWSHTEEFEDIYTDITLRNQRFSWFNNEFHNHSIRVRHASKRSMYSSSRGRYCIHIRNKLKAQSLCFCVRMLFMVFFFCFDIKSNKSYFVFPSQAHCIWEKWVVHSVFIWFEFNSWWFYWPL